MKKIFGGSPLYPQLTLFWPENGKFGEIDSADTSAGKFPLVPKMRDNGDNYRGKS